MTYYAELETDKFIRENFFPNLEEKLTMVEVGAGPPLFYSMSQHFRENGWRCICIDPNPKFVEMHKKLGNEIYQFACSNVEGNQKFSVVETSWGENENGISYSSLDIRYPIDENHKITEIYVETKKLNSILEQLEIEKVDFISVDTEGWEIEVMMGLDIEKYRPKVILLENFQHLETYQTFMESIGYILVEKINYNYIFTPKK